MSKRDHQALKQGTFYHERCDSCVESDPALKMHLDDEDKLLAIVRYTTCGSHVWDFSVGLLGWHRTTKGLADIVRACSAHSNYHLHRWEYLFPRKKVVPESLAILDNEEQATEAFGMAQANVVGNAFEWRESWRPKKH